MDQVFLLFYDPNMKCAGHKSTGKKWGSVTYVTDCEYEVSKILCLWG